MSLAELEALIPRRDTELSLVWMGETDYSSLISRSSISRSTETYREFDDLFTVGVGRVLQPQTAVKLTQITQSGCSIKPSKS